MLERSSGVILESTPANATVPRKVFRSLIAVHNPGKTVVANGADSAEFDLRGNRERSLYGCNFVTSFLLLVPKQKTDFDRSGSSVQL